MLPEQTKFPEFVPDQLLTSDHLNKLFGYLDEQGRMTRTNLIGIGIACGLEVSTAADGTSITISGGCGVTSEGYLVSMPDMTYTRYKTFDAVKEIIYDEFVNKSIMKQRFPLDELMEAAVEDGTTPLSAAYLQDKIVLIFVELLEEGAKNCDPNSCDDKGVSVTVSFRPLLVSQKDVAALALGIGTDANGSSTNTYDALPVLKMRRFDVPATDITSTADVFNIYRKLLDAAMLQKTEQVLGAAYATFAPLVADLYATNPFSGLAARFSFLHNAGISLQDLVMIQYYYDLFSDVMAAYEELRIKGAEAMGMCCPDSELFPRHLLLGPAIGSTQGTVVSYRHYFIPSPLLQCRCNLVTELRWLFKRLVLLIQEFIPAAGNNNDTTGFLSSKRNILGAPIRITPSRFGNVTLSEKSIPFYYEVNGSPDKLYQYWNYNKTKHGKANRNLSYHAPEYNNTDDDIIHPLRYDLEAYNFLRIEGHIGRRYTQALTGITTLRDTNRLPFDVIALSADVDTLRAELLAILRSTSTTGIKELFQGDNIPKCHFQDLEALYDTVAADLVCTLCKQMQYFYSQSMTTDVQLPAPASTVPQAPLLKRCDPAFRFRANTLGHEFEIFYQTIKNQPYISAANFASANSFSSSLSGTAVTNEDRLYLALLYYMEKLSEIITTALISFNIAAYTTRYRDLLLIARLLLVRVSRAADGNGDDGQEDMLERLISVCNPAQFVALYNDYKIRWSYLAMLQKFGYYAKLHPGMQHKAGVPVGGTLIMVYHERPKTVRTNNALEFIANNDRVAAEEIIAVRKENMEMASHPEEKAAPAAALGITSDVSGAEKTMTPEVESHIALSNVHEVNLQQLKNVASANQLAIINRLFAANPAIQEEALKALIDKIPDGTVIADFYLPYMCCSDCPPVYYIVQETTDNTPGPTISLKSAEYCSDDKTSYPVDVSPAGGTVTGEGVVAASGGFTFNPSGVTIDANALSKDVTLTYKTADGDTATVKITVYKKPVAAFTNASGSTFSIIQFASQSQNAAQYLWDLGDGTTSTDANPLHDYGKEGTFTVTLKVINGICSDTTAPVTVTIKKTGTKKCQSLQDIIDGFNNLEKINEAGFKRFTSSFAPYKDVNDFFSGLAKLVSSTVQKQLDFFASGPVQSLFPRWLQELNKFIIEGTEARVIALALFRLLLMLAMYIACVQQEDADKAKISMAETLNLAAKLMSGWATFIANMTPAEKDQLSQMLTLFKQEADQVVANGEDKTKPTYLSLLKSCIDIMGKFKLN
ncbi:PKD domain-containing protein [Chitinophagaceae bacterium MMS25-I14]